MSNLLKFTYFGFFHSYENEPKTFRCILTFTPLLTGFLIGCFDDVKEQIRRKIALEQMERTVSVDPLWDENGVTWFYIMRILKSFVFY